MFLMYSISLNPNVPSKTVNGRPLRLLWVIYWLLEEGKKMIRICNTPIQTIKLTSSNPRRRAVLLSDGSLADFPYLSPLPFQLNCSSFHLFGAARDQ